MPLTAKSSRGSGHDRKKHGQVAAGAGGGQARVARHVANPRRANPEAAAELPADDPGDDGDLHAAAEHPWFLPLRSGRAAATDPPADGPAVDGAGPAAAADVPAASPATAAGLPADDPGGAWQLLAALQHTPLLRPEGFAGHRVPDRELRRVDRGGHLPARRRPLRRGASGGPGPRGAPPAARHGPGESRPQDKIGLLSPRTG